MAEILDFDKMAEAARLARGYLRQKEDGLWWWQSPNPDGKGKRFTDGTFAVFVKQELNFVMTANQVARMRDVKGWHIYHPRQKVVPVVPGRPAPSPVDEKAPFKLLERVMKLEEDHENLQAINTNLHTRISSLEHQQKQLVTDLGG